MSLASTLNSLAYYGYPFSQCQSPKFPLESQLENGVRVLDVRLAVVNNNLIAYHGIVSQQVAFTTVLEVVQKFLNAHKTEFFAVRHPFECGLMIRSSSPPRTETLTKSFSLFIVDVY